ncbi:SPOC domain-like protein [Metschnikowia bicuspidata var. bicuspidata NRRL YB-4993]|uniref:ATP-dependent DNA helicase II subunit 1 n=1 Tax=Metschnikowia bicuspidata var. bicuspidata NRRL YB-4993 TaxID=869754 RepID=A0A1A0HAE0_9ASCO|nr:SPOC domain-like protein [Metschnikowia bicuspidata var. bicuspidata NRRL YB-4993]OBA20970.1 SPOC domain-like protein [Metschnikowia bicuspidata var. bicuspidata NRRL YB-4993]
MEEPFKQYEIREGIVFLLELSDAIYTPIRRLKNQTQIGEILSCINDLLSEMVITFPNNGVGIYLYNCSTTGSKYAKNSGLNKIFSLNDLNSSNMKLLINTMKDDAHGGHPLKQRFRPVDKPGDNLHTVLKTVLREFQRKPQYNRKKLFWFTNNDRPYINEKLKDSLRTMISDFEDNQIHVTPLFLDTFTDNEQHRPKPFDASLYQNIFLNTNYLRPAESLDPDAEFGAKKDPMRWLKTTVSSQIRDSIFRLKEVKRVQFSCDLVLSDGPEIGGRLGCSVKGYTLYNHEQIRLFKKVSTESGEIRMAHTDTKRLKSGTTKELDPHNLESNMAIYKGVPVKFSNDESEPQEKILLLKPEVLDFMGRYSFDHIPKDYKQEIDGEASVGDCDDETTGEQVEFSNAPYLKLLCFRKLRKFQPYFNMKPPLFVAADLNDGLSGSLTQGGYSNSFDTFKTLYQSCVRLKKYAILFGCTKRTSNPNLYALYPTNISGESTSKTPDGFLLFNLPWLSEIRSLPDHMLTNDGGKFIPEHEDLKPTQLVTLYGKLVDHIQPWAGYEPSAYENPTLHYFYKTIKQEALQLDTEHEDLSLQANDWSVRELLKFRKNIDAERDVQSTFRFLNQVLGKIDKQYSTKREADAETSASKKRKVESLSEAAVITVWKNDTWKNVRVDQLREFMNRYDGIKKASRKTDMIANIIEFLESKRR